MDFISDRGGLAILIVGVVLFILSSPTSLLWFAGVGLIAAGGWRWWHHER